MQIWTSPSLPVEQAQCKGVSPSLSRRFTSAPHHSNAKAQKSASLERKGNAPLSFECKVSPPSPEAGESKGREVGEAISRWIRPSV